MIITLAVPLIPPVETVNPPAADIVFAAEFKTAAAVLVNKPLTVKLPPVNVKVPAPKVNLYDHVNPAAGHVIVPPVDFVIVGVPAVDCCVKPLTNVIFPETVIAVFKRNVPVKFVKSRLANDDAVPTMIVAVLVPVNVVLPETVKPAEIVNVPV